MHQLNNYDVYIFDCDGVILDSNQLKIEAMKNTLEVFFTDQILVESCVDYFRNNFGKSRFHHVSHFLNSILDIKAEQKPKYEQMILERFSEKCRELYLTANLTPSFISFLEQCGGKKYVASGSEQEELRDVFETRGLNKYFDGVFGSPTPKAELIRHILEHEQSRNVVMFGDAESDMLSAQTNDIDFIFYAPLSNVKSMMLNECKKYQYPIIYDFTTIRI